MSEKKNRFNHRKWNRRKHNGWCGVPSSEKRWNKLASRRFIRARNRQRIREGRFELLQPYRMKWGYYW